MRFVCFFLERNIFTGVNKNGTFFTSNALKETKKNTPDCYKQAGVLIGI